MSQTNLIHGTNWDVLIILDACRFDVFKRQHKKYLKGTLKKVVSPASNTPTWLMKTWPNLYDLIYVSANPYINSKGIPAGQNNFVSRDHFKKIVDVWDFGWSDELRTVHPRAVNIAVKNMKLKGKMVIHYAQPHKPYIGKIRHTQGRGWKKKREMAYIETLEIVLKHVSELIPFLPEKIVISSDHGELMGELGRWGRHPPQIDHPALRNVPWFDVLK